MNPLACSFFLRLAILELELILFPNKYLYKSDKILYTDIGDENA